jgi:uncharacterized protein involved in exopolysaccharide biosynthesis
MSGRDDDAESLAASASLFDRRDRERVHNYASFVGRSVRRHRLIFLTVFLSIIGGTVASILVFPKTYHVEAKALAQRNSALVVRGDGPGAESLTRVAVETVMRRDNLIALIQQTDLLQYMREHRAPIQRAKDVAVRALHLHQESEADRLDTLVEQLEKKLVVWTGESGNTVTIAIDWSDAPMACRLVDAAQRAFLDARYAREVTALSEAIEILRSHTASLKADVDAAVSGIDKMRYSKGEPKPDPAEPTASPQSQVLSLLRAPAPRSPVENPRIQQLKAQLDAKQHAIDELEEFRRHRMSDLQSRLSEARMTFTESHPTIVDLKQSIAALSVESPQVTALRQDVAALRAEHDRIGGTSEAPGLANGGTPTFGNLIASAGGTPPRLSSEALKLDLDLREDRDPAMVYARGQLRDAMDKYAALRSQIETSEIDLETAKAAFKYRYSVITPAHLPKGPTKPNIPVVLIAALAAAILCGCLVAALVDVRRGRVLERWQIERLLDRPILGEITLPLLEGPDYE